MAPLGCTQLSVRSAKAKDCRIVKRDALDRAFFSTWSRCFPGFWMYRIRQIVTELLSYPVDKYDGQLRCLLSWKSKQDSGEYVYSRHV
jgi:hypothetical protein